MRWLLVALVVAAAGGVGWLLLGEEPTASDADAGTERCLPTDEAGERAVTLAGAEGAGPRSLRAALGRCGIKVKVTRAGHPAVARVEARYVSAVAALQNSWVRWQREMFLPPAPPAPAAATGTSDVDGHALLAGLAAGVYRLSARTDDGAQAETGVSIPTDGATVLTVLELREGGQSLEGKVTWTDGTGVGGMLILTPPLSRGAVNTGYYSPVGQISVPLVADGSFVVGGLGTGGHGVRLLAGDSLSVNLPPAALPASKPYLVTLEPLTKRVTGRVLDALSDAPIPGAAVLGSSGLGHNLWASMRTVTDADGRFEVFAARLPAWFTVTAPGYGTGGRNVQSMGTEPVVIRLIRTGRIAGRVSARDGSAAVGAVVCASGGSNNNPVRVCATADKEGRYTLEEVSAGEAVVVVRGGGWTSPDLGDVRSEGFNPFVVPIAGGDSLTVDLVAVPCGRLEGKTLDAAGAPVAGATVSTNAAWSGGGGQVVWRLQYALGQESAASDENGAFVLENLVPGMSYTLVAQSPDQPQAQAGPFVVSADPSPPVELKFPVARWVDVRVLFEGESGGVPEARVQVMQIQGPGNWSQMPGTWNTDREGRVRAGPIGPSPQGDLGVQASGDVVAANRTPVAIEGSKEAPGPFAVTLRLPRGRAIEGKVLKPDGTPASGAWVSAQMKEAPNTHAGGTQAAGDGTFSLKGLGAGTYNVNAGLQQPDGKQSWNGSCPAEAGAAGVTITLVEAPPQPVRDAIVVKVLDHRGEPARSAQVRLSVDTSNSTNGTQNGTVRFEFGKGNNDWIAQGLARGALHVEAWVNRGASEVPLAAGPARVGPLGADQREVEVRLPPERTIEGRVVADDGTGVRGVLVRARPLPDPANRNYQPPYAGEGRSDAQGRFRVGSLGEGEHAIEVSVPPDFLVPETSPVAAGTRGLEVVLRRGLTARIRVRDPEGQPLGRAQVNPQIQVPPNLTQAQQQEWHRRRNLVQQQRPPEAGTTGQDGLVVLRGLDPEMTYSLHVSAPKEDMRPAHIPRWTPADTEVQLERGYVITGSMRDPQGRLVPGAQLYQKNANGGWGGMSVNGDGTFRLVALARGMVTLAAIPPGGQINWNDANLPSITVAAGTENLTIVVEPGVELVVRVSNAADRGPNGQHVHGQVLVRRNDVWEQRGWANDGEGRLVFKGLRPDETYAVWVQPIPGSDLFGWVTGLRAGAGEAVVRLARGGTIRGRITLPAGAGEQGVGANGEHGIWVQGTLDSEGRYEIRGLPDMRWKVHAWANVQQKHWNAQGDIATGGTLDLRLEQPAEGR
jgi:hypothetical protein